MAGADANPYLVMAMVLAGIHYGVTQKCEPGPPVAECTKIPASSSLLPVRWEAALEAFRQSSIIPQYMSTNYFESFAKMRQYECDAFHAAVSSQDYEWYLRAV